MIVAVPPTLAGRIHYHSELPTVRDQLTQRMPQGTLIKVACVYDEPFWREAGLNGPVNAPFEDSPPGGQPGVNTEAGERGIPRVHPATRSFATAAPVTTWAKR